MKFRIFLGLLVLLMFGWSESFAYNAKVSVCFTPQQNCTAQIVSHIKKARHFIYMQGYSFTSSPIGRALVKAHERGVKVAVILDKSNFDCSHFSYVSYLLRHHVPIWNDFLPNIAHNKVMIFDERTVETGSFNYTKSAQYYNTENVVFITSKPVASAFLNNWYKRKRNAKPVLKDPCHKRYYRK